MLRKYQKIGLRQDKNLSDVENADAALNNLLNDISSELTSQDVKIAVTGLRNTNVESTDIYRLSGLAETNSDDQYITPVTTIQDSINNYRVYTGEPAFYRGGRGMDATFFPADNIGTVSTTPSTATGTNIIGTPNGTQTAELYWDDGVFFFDSKLHPLLNGVNGLVQWEGYAATISDPTVLRCETTGFFLIEINKEADDVTAGTWETIAGRTTIRRSFSWIPTVTDNVSVIPLSEITSSLLTDRQFGVGDTLVQIDATEVGNDGITIAGIDYDEDLQIVLSSPISVTSGVSVTLSFEYKFGIDEVSVPFALPRTALGDKLKVRYSVWWPDQATTPGTNFNAVFFANPSPSVPYAQKSVIFEYSSTDNNHYSQYYTNFTKSTFLGAWDTQNDLPISFADNSFEQFYKKRVSHNHHVSKGNLATTDKFLFNYQPKVSRADFMKDISFTYEGGHTIRGDFSQVEEGWIIYPIVSGFNAYYVQIRQKFNNELAFIDNIEELYGITPGLTWTNRTCFDPTGFVGAFSGSGSTATTVNLTMQKTLSEFSNLIPIKNQIKPGMFITNIESRSSATISGDVYRITEVIDQGGNSVGIVAEDFTGSGRALNATNNSVEGYIVYNRRGLEDSTKTQFCEGVTFVEVLTAAGATTSSFQTEDLNGTQAGDYVLFDGIIPLSTSINSITGTGPYTINLNKSFTKELSQGFAVTVVPQAKYNSSGTPGTPTFPNFELCVIPPNTAPPFEGTDTGLKTTASNHKLKVDNKLVFQDLTINGVTTSEVVATSPTHTGTLEVTHTETVANTVVTTAYRILFD